MPNRESLAWAVLTRTPGINPAALRTALDTLGEATGILGASDQLRARAGLGPATRAFLNSAAAAPTSAEVDWLATPQHQLLSLLDPRYPAALRDLTGGPVALYVHGDAAVVGVPQLAIVGSRNPTAQGRDNAFAFARYLAEHGLGVTSGLAEGIDTAAHRGALAGRGATVAVLGTGLDIIYPHSNQELARQIAASGALVSEFPLGTPARRGNFPRRNRIIAGLALGTLVVEAARHSGALVTARFAGEFGREVFAIPGSIHNLLARGCHQLIRQGAKLTETAADILSELNFSLFPGQPAAPSPTPVMPTAAVAGMDNDHKILLDALGFDLTDLDVLVARTGFNAQAVSSMMLILELEGHVQAAPGGRYSRVLRSP